MNEARARTIAVKFREADFSTFTRRITLGSPVDTAEKIFPIVGKLLKGLFRKNVPVRLIGVFAVNLEMETDSRQMALFDQAPQKDQKLAEALDDITQRFGDQAIKRAALVNKKEHESRW